MNTFVSIDEALADCLEAMKRGEAELEACLERYPQYRSELTQLLRLVTRLCLVLRDVDPSPVWRSDWVTARSLEESLRQPVAADDGTRDGWGSRFYKDSRRNFAGSVSMAVHTAARGYPLLAWLALFSIFSLFAFFAWLPTVGSALVIKAVSPALGTLLVFLGFSLLPCLLLHTVVRSTTKWLRSLIFSPALSSSPGYLWVDAGSCNGMIGAFKAGWNSQDAAVRLWYRIMAWSALRVIALFTVFSWAMPLVSDALPKG